MTKPNKTTKYLFWPNVVLFEADVTIRSFIHIGVINAYMKDKAQEGAKGLLYILVDSSTDTFQIHLKRIKRSQFFVRSYAVGEPEDDLCVIEYKILKEDAVDSFMESQYSKMYPHQLIKNNLEDRFSLLEKVGLWGVPHVLLRTEEGYQALLDHLGIHPQSSIGEHLKTMEYGSLLIESEETMDSNNIIKVEKRDGVSELVW